MEGETIKFEVKETRKDLSIIIVDDEALEELEYFNVSIRAVPGVFPVVVKNSQAIVEIVDNDREHTHTHAYKVKGLVMMDVNILLCSCCDWVQSSDLQHKRRPKCSVHFCSPDVWHTPEKCSSAAINQPRLCYWLV